MKYFLNIILVIVAINPSLRAQSVVRVSQIINVTLAGPGSLVSFELKGFLPRDIPNRQRVIDIRFYGAKIQKIHSDKSDYYQYKFDGQSNYILNNSIVIEYDLELYDFDLSIAQNKSIKLSEDRIDLKKYIKASSFERKDHKRILEVIPQINGVSEFETLKNIFDYVVSNLEYDNGINENIGAVKALKKGRGDCTEFSDLMVTLCRAKGIPSRVVTGSIAKTAKNPNHNWVEVYINKYGWLPFDPTFADSKSASFEDIPNKYIYLNRERTDSSLGSSVFKYNWRTSSMDTRVFVESTYQCDKSFNKLLRQASEYYHKEDYPKAIELLNYLLTIDNLNVRCITFKAMIFAREGNFKDANQFFQIALRNSNHDYEIMTASYSYANYLSLIGDYEGSVKYLRTAIDYGFDNFEHLKEDKDLVDLRKTEIYKEFLDEINLN